MATVEQVRANKCNALRSTGPISPKGKGASKANALVHGLRSIDPVMPSEDPKLWHNFLNAITDSLSPVGELEVCLAGTVALTLWRLKRVVNYEIATSIAKLNLQNPPDQELTEQQKLEAELKKLEASHRIWEQERQVLQLLQKGAKDMRVSDVDAFRFFEIAAGYLDQLDFDPHDPAFLATFGKDGELLDDGSDPYDRISWKVRHLALGLEYLAKAAGCSFDKAVEKLRTEIYTGYDESHSEMVKVRKAIRRLKQKNESRQAQLNALHGMLSTEEIDKVCRYEGHLNRVLLTTLERLKQLQLVRHQDAAPLPSVAVGITVAAKTQTNHQGYLLDDTRLDSVVPREMKQVHAIQQPVGC